MMHALGSGRLVILQFPVLFHSAYLVTFLEEQYRCIGVESFIILH